VYPAVRAIAFIDRCFDWTYNGHLLLAGNSEKKTYDVNKQLILGTLPLLLASVVLQTAAAPQTAADPGVTKTEIKIGNITSYTGRTKEYGAIGRAEAAYFLMINDRGGIRGRKIVFTSVDNGSDASKSEELARKLVEQDGVLLIFSSFGTEGSLAMRAYLNEQKVPQLFVDSSSTVFNDPSHFPWTMGFYATYRTEGMAYARYILQNKRDAKIAILYENNDAGREYLSGVHEGLAEKAATLIVKELSYDGFDPAVDSEIADLKNSGANVFLNLSVGMSATRIIRKTYDIDWHPLQFIPNASLSVAAFLEPAGLEKSTGIVSNARSKGWLQGQSRNDPAVHEFVEWMGRYNPQASLRDQNNVAGYERAEALVEVLNKCGDDLSRANVMKQAANLNIELGMLRPGVRIKTSASDYQPIKELFLVRFNGKEWEPFGPVIGQ
jgi:branched-chain amino acid transport system substrate-binding protein